jgi:hypothetical protein
VKGLDTDHTIAFIGLTAWRFGALKAGIAIETGSILVTYHLPIRPYCVIKIMLNWVIQRMGLWRSLGLLQGEENLSRSPKFAKLYRTVCRSVPASMRAA